MKAWPSFAALFLLISIWGFAVKLAWVPNYLLPSPMEVALAIIENWSDFQLALLSTFKSTAIGFLLSALLGFLTALAFVFFPVIKRALLPFAVFFQTVPVIAIAPLLVIWFGFGEPTVRASAFIVSFFPILASTMTGLGNVEPAHIELFKAFGAKRWQTLFLLQIPSSLASVFSGLQISAGLAVIGAIVGEFVAGGGLGGMIDSARTQQRVDLVFAAILLASLLGVVFVSAIRKTAKKLVCWRPFFPTDAA